MTLFAANEQANAPLADRMRPRTLDEFYGQEHIVGPGRLLRRAITDGERGLGKRNVQADEDTLRHIPRIANGDVRTALNALELAALTTPTVDGGIHITLSFAEDSIQQPVIRCGDTEFYDMLSAFCKSMRGSDPDVALLWFSLLLYAGADPRMLARRVIAHASEDVGLANPAAMLQAVAAAQALEKVGVPEARLSLTQAVLAVCVSSKSNSVAVAMSAARRDAKQGDFGPVPAHLRDSHYAGNERLGVKKIIMKKYLAECIGTATLVILGCGTAMLVGCDAVNGGGYILTALAAGVYKALEAK